jgi:hypothetical protein
MLTLQGVIGQAADIGVDRVIIGVPSSEYRELCVWISPGSIGVQGGGMADLQGVDIRLKIDLVASAPADDDSAAIAAAELALSITAALTVDRTLGGLVHDMAFDFETLSGDELGMPRTGGRVVGAIDLILSMDQGDTDA